MEQVISSLSPTAKELEVRNQTHTCSERLGTDGADMEAISMPRGSQILVPLFQILVRGGHKLTGPAEQFDGGSFPRSCSSCAEERM